MTFANGFQMTSTKSASTWIARISQNSAKARSIHSAVCILSQRRIKPMSVELNVKCPVCGKAFHLKPYRIKRANQNYCSRKCFYEAKKSLMSGSGNHQYGLRGELNSSWKGGRKITRYGYMAVYMPDHPFAQYGKIVFEHRLVAEENLLTAENSIEINGKRYLRPEYIVHHKNHNRLDNRPENLEVMLKGEHSSLHTSENQQPRNPINGRFIKRE